MIRYMLDTNIVSHLLKGNPVVARHLVSLPMSSVCISAITEGELHFGLAKRPEAKRLHEAVREFLKRAEVLPWDSSVAEQHGSARACLERAGKSLAPLDLLIASHALAASAVLVTNERAFSQVADLKQENRTVE